MKMVSTMKYLISVIGLSLIFQSLAFANEKGMVQFKDLSDVYGEPKIEVNLNAMLMGMMGSIAQHSDPVAADVLKKLQQISVRVYQMDGNSKSALESVKSITKKIRKDNWQPIVNVNEENEQIKIFSKMTGDKIDGVVVMAVNNEGAGGEAIFINIVGDIDPQNISKVTDSLNIDLGQ